MSAPLSWEKISIRKMTRPAACHYPICSSDDMPLSDTARVDTSGVDTSGVDTPGVDTGA
jgi:hypothetical protein